MNVMLHISVDEQVRRKADRACAAMGMELSDAVGLFLGEVAAKQLPFTPIMDAKRAKVLKKKWDAEAAWALKYGKRYATAKELHESIR